VTTYLLAARIGRAFLPIAREIEAEDEEAGYLAQDFADRVNATAVSGLLEAFAGNPPLWGAFRRRIGPGALSRAGRARLTRSFGGLLQAQRSVRAFQTPPTQPLTKRLSRRASRARGRLAGMLRGTGGGLADRINGQAGFPVLDGQAVDGLALVFSRDQALWAAFGEAVGTWAPGPPESGPKKPRGRPRKGT
jgi:hypothetical protein